MKIFEFVRKPSGIYGLSGTPIVATDLLMINDETFVLVAGAGLSIDINGNIQLGDNIGIEYTPPTTIPDDTNINDAYLRVNGRLYGYYSDGTGDSLYIGSAVVGTSWRTLQGSFYNDRHFSNTNRIDYNAGTDFWDIRQEDVIYTQFINGEYVGVLKGIFSTGVYYDLKTQYNFNGGLIEQYRLLLSIDPVTRASSYARFTDSINSKGLEYEGDYESNFTARSLITKQYVDDNFVTQTYADNNFVTQLYVDTNFINLTTLENSTLIHLPAVNNNESTTLGQVQTLIADSLSSVTSGKYKEEFIYSGNNVFTLSSTPTIDSLDVFIQGQLQPKTGAYTLVGNQVTINNPLDIGDRVIFNYTVGDQLIVLKESVQMRTNTIIRFDFNANHGFTTTTPLTGGITFDLTNSVIGNTALLKYKSLSDPTSTFPSYVVIIAGFYDIYRTNYFSFYLASNFTGSELVLCTISQNTDLTDLT